MSLFVFSSLSKIFVYLVFAMISYKGFQSLHFEQLIRKNQVANFKILLGMLSIALGYLVANFCFAISEQLTNLGQGLIR